MCVQQQFVLRMQNVQCWKWRLLVKVGPVSRESYAFVGVEGQFHEYVALGK